MFILHQETFGKDEFLSKLKEEVSTYTIVANKIQYYNVASSFDIETSSFYIGGEKQSCMYMWSFGINGFATYGRTWLEYNSLLDEVKTIMGLSDSRRLEIYVHNLPYEFQYMKNRYEWSKVFSIEKRKPVYASTFGVDYKCSYKLSGYSLETVSKNLQKYKISKLVGDLDYSLIRTSETPLTEKEIKYSIHDVLVVMAYIQEKIESDGDITKIPLTKTGYVRQYCRNNCLYTTTSHKYGAKKFKAYRNLMKSMTISPKEYEQLKRAFQGGFTHASFNHSMKVLTNVGSFDFTSSYPYVMVSEKFPIGSSRRMEITSDEQLQFYLKNYCCMFDVTFYELESREYYEHPISFSKCWNVGKRMIDNGRIVWAEKLSTTVTELDWEVINKFYIYSKVDISNFTYYPKGYLPTNLVKSILELYKKKTTLKGVDGMEVEYLGSKEMVNAAYGMMVTDICRPEILFSSCLDDEWIETPPDIETALDKYNKSVKRFLFYPWGVWVTAYARRNLFTGIYSCGEDYIYSDTDSIKILNPDKHMEYINRYNKEVVRKLEEAMKFHKIPISHCSPKTVKGVSKTLGVWEYEGMYTRFKTLGAKRYMVEKDGKISLTVSGINKKLAMPYLQSKFSDPFTAFKDGMYIPAEFSGKKTHTYLDTPMHGFVYDYTGELREYNELSGIHIENAPYELSSMRDYINYLMGVRKDDKYK